MKFKKVISCILAMIMVISVMPVSSASEEKQATIVGYELVGKWDTIDNPALCYDGQESTKWNPTVIHYEQAPGIIFQLDGCYDLTTVQLSMEKRCYYFDLFVSGDGVSFTRFASVTAENQNECYVEDYVCRLTELKAENASFVKLVYTGTGENTNWVNLQEITIFGTDAYANESKIQFTSGTTEGKWQSVGKLTNAYDNDESTKWNPQATDYNSGESVIFSFDRAVNISALRILFEKRSYYFTVAVSSDGMNYTQISEVNSENKNIYYSSDNLCTVHGFTSVAVQFVKLSFIGSSNGSMSVYLDEIWAYATPEKESEQTPESVKTPLTIISAMSEGAWEIEGDCQLAYDGDENTKWNPKAIDSLAGKGVVFQMEDTCDLSVLQICFAGRYYYFDVALGDENGNFWTVASVTPDNFSQYYSDYLCKFENLSGAQTKQVKVVFTGSSDNSPWLNFHEIEVYGEKTGVKTQKAGITDAVTEGIWQNTENIEKAFDGDTGTIWEPTATNYKAGESAVFTLDRAHDLTKLEITVGQKYHYFKISVSPDGKTYTQIADVNAANYKDYYLKDYVCTVTGFYARNVQYIKVQFTGNADAVQKEIAVRAAVEESGTPTIVSGVPTGTWVMDRVGSASVPPEASYDSDLATMWNPQAEASYPGNPSIVYTLDGVYDLTQLQLVHKLRHYYYTVAVSEDGESYKTVATVDAKTAASYYSADNICTMSLNAKNVKYIKLTFTGNAQTGNTYVALYDIRVQGTAAKESGTPTIVSGVPTGSWLMDRIGSASVSPECSYDSNLTTMWNPQAEASYLGNPGIVYTLDGVYDLTQLQLVHKLRHYYYTVAVSEDGESYTTAATVNAATASKYYSSDNTCTLPLNVKNVKYIKLTFTGNAQAGNTYVALYDIAVQGMTAQANSSPEVNFCEIAAYGYPLLVSQWNLALQEDITANFQFSLPQRENVQIQMQIGDKTESFTTADMVAQGDGRYLLSYDLAAAQMTDEIMFTVKYDGKTEVSRAYSVRGYADTVLSDKQHADYHNIVRQMLSYGSAAQQYFTYSTDTLADKGIVNSAQRTVPQGQTQDIQVIGKAKGVSFYGTSMVFLDKIALYFYFNGGEDVTFCLNGTACSPEKTDTGCRIMVPDINLQDLDEKVTVTATDSEGNTITVIYSPMNYIVRMSLKGSEDLQTLLQRLYNLHLAAEELVSDQRNNTTYLTAAIDDLGRSVDPVANGNQDKEVGIFYLLWLGTGGDSIYDVSQILKNNPNAAISDEAWQAAGGGENGLFHWWGESIFGHYYSVDSWVVERDVMMLTDAGIDFLALDNSNAVGYPQQLLVLLKALDKYYRQGYDVPQVTFIVKADTGAHTMRLFESVYKAYPQYSHLWYRMEGKPMIIADEDDPAVTEECRDYLSFQYAQWPREGYRQDGFPWMDFGWWTENGKQAVFHMKDGRTMMNATVAQHSGTLAFSSSALYGDNTNRTRSWHNGANDPAEDAYLYGYNFAEQLDYAISCDPDILFLTGWNEWIAARQSAWHSIDADAEPIILVDNCDINNSRDIQPMKGGYGDNYYMQMIAAIRRFKGQSPTNVGLNTSSKIQNATIDIAGSLRQWDQIHSFYLDYLQDTDDRNCVGYGDVRYTNTTGRNDIYQIKLTNDNENLYVYVQTDKRILGVEEGRCLTMFLSTGNGANKTWCNYDFAVGRLMPGVVEKRTAKGWETVYTGAYNLVENELQFAIPLSVLGENAADVSLQFKFADNYQNEDDIFEFYLNGDAAPYGRLNYVYESRGMDAARKE